MASVKCARYCQCSTGAPAPAPAPAKITTPGPSRPRPKFINLPGPRSRPIILPPAPAINHAFTGGTAGDFTKELSKFLKKMKYI